jgi:hypothetical protein
MNNPLFLHAPAAEIKLVIAKLFGGLPALHPDAAVRIAEISILDHHGDFIDLAVSIHQHTNAQFTRVANLLEGKASAHYTNPPFAHTAAARAVIQYLQHVWAQKGWPFEEVKDDVLFPPKNRYVTDHKRLEDLLQGGPYRHFPPKVAMLDVAVYQQLEKTYPYAPSDFISLLGETQGAFTNRFRTLATRLPEELRPHHPAALEIFCYYGEAIRDVGGKLRPVPAAILWLVNDFRERNSKKPLTAERAFPASEFSKFDPKPKPATPPGP